MAAHFNAVILAAGLGKRLKLNTPKALLEAVGRRLIDYPIFEIERFNEISGHETHTGVVLGHMREKVENWLNEHHKRRLPGLEIAYQEKQLGTADALKSYFSGVPEAKKNEYTIVLCGDTPLIRAEDLKKITDILIGKKLNAVAATFVTVDPCGYGRIVRGGKGFQIVEEKDATPEIRLIQEVNSGLYVFRTSFILEHIADIHNTNKAGEFYLTDLFQNDYPVGAVCFPDGDMFMGVNDIVQLEKVTKLLRQEKNRKLAEQGVRFIDAAHTWIDYDVEIGGGSIIYPNTFLEGETRIGCDVSIGPGSIIRDSIIADNVVIKAYSHIEEAVIRREAQIGPFARLRPKADIGEKAKVGNFVEIKKSVLHSGVKVSHLSYVGDAEIGEGSNIGCGFITCNYDGVAKHVTKIGKGTFIGSDCQTIAPVEIGNNCFIGAGSTINENVPDETFAIARARQVNKAEMAKKFLKKNEK